MNELRANNDDDLCRVEGQWHPVCLEPRQERTARDEIGAAGYPVYLPMVWQNERHGRGSTRTVQRPMFGPYLFVKCPDVDHNWSRVTSARGVQRLLKTAAGSMGVVSEPEIHVIRLAEFESYNQHAGMLKAAAEENARREAEAAQQAAARNARELAEVQKRAARCIVWSFTAEQQVRIKSGPFAGFYARLTGAVDERGRIDALVDLFRGSVRANLSPFHLEAL